MMLLCAGAEAQPSVTAKSKPQPVPITRSAPMVKPEVYRVPPEMTGGDARPFATEFYGTRPKKQPRPTAKKPARTAQR
jgi:hypothetical protein